MHAYLIFGIIIILVVLLFAYCCCVVSGRCSREEEYKEFIERTDKKGLS